MKLGRLAGFLMAVFLGGVLFLGQGNWMRRVRATDYCNSNATQGDCTDEFDCDSLIKKIEWMDTKICEPLQGCYEVVEWGGNFYETYCYARLDKLASGSNCGGLDSPCCPSPDEACESPLILVTSDGRECLCKKEEEVSVPKKTSNKIFCNADRKPAADPADPENPEIYTALGCVPGRIEGFMVWLLPYIFGIAGGIAFLLMAGGFIQMAASKGDPKAVQAAKETIGSALTGLLVSIFAIFILRLIAVDILHIPGMK